MANQLISVEVAYALPNKQMIIPLHVKRGTTMFEAAQESGIVDKFPELDIESIAMGVFGKAERNPKQRELEDGERVELYRPLIADPKEVRKRRAAEKDAAEKAAKGAG